MSIRQVQTIPLNKQPTTIVRDDRELHNGNGDYSFIVELTDGTRFAQNARTVPEGGDEDSEVSGLVITGHYSFVDASTGEIHLVEYIADKKGYRPTITVLKKKEKDIDNKLIEDKDDFSRKNEFNPGNPKKQVITKKISSTQPPTTTTTTPASSISQRQTDEDKNASMIKSNLGDKPTANFLNAPLFSEQLEDENQQTKVKEAEAETTQLPPLDTIAASIFSSPDTEELS